MSTQKYCVLFDGRRSKAIPLPYAEGVQARFKKHCAGAFPIEKYEQVRNWKIYDSMDLFGLFI